MKTTIGSEDEHMQKLIQSVNNMTISASFLNSAYYKKFGFKHYGTDCYGSATIYAQGIGTVLATGTDSCYGNFVVVLYPDVECKGDIVANYFHLASIATQKGAAVTKDSKLGVMGKTGTYATGIHLHTEMRPHKPGQAACLSPFATSHFKKDLEAGWFNPLTISHCKSSPPDYQTYAASKNVYINEEDTTTRKIVTL
jgi:murein DD-endopeptidase MepM/ murein hydrolase activator NlpD